MDIAIDIRSLSEGRHSGVEEYTTQLIHSMVKEGKEHTFHLFHNSARSVNIPQFFGNVEVHVWRYPNKVFNAVQWLTGYPRWDKMVHADCFFVPNFRITPLSQGVPFVTTVHDLSFDLFPEFFSYKRRLWHKMVRPELLMKNSDHLIAVSESTASNMTEFYDIDPDKITVIPSGVKESNVTEAQIKAVKYKYELPDTFILFLGVLEPRKNISSIVDAWSMIAGQVPQDLVIAGEKGWLKKGIRKSIDESSSAERIYMPGFIEEIDKQALYAAADLFVFPSFYEGFGFPPLEALVAGTPVIISSSSSLPETVGKWANLVDPYNITELSLVMKELLKENRRIPQKIIRDILKQYNWDAAARKTLRVLEGQA